MGQQEVDVDDIMANVLENRKPIDPAVFGIKANYKHKHTGKHSNKLRLYLFSTALIILIIGLVITYLHFRKAENIKMNDSNRSINTSTFSLYYPTAYPSGFALEENSKSTSSTVATYTASDTKDNKIFFSFQPLPAESVTENFHTDILNAPEKIYSGIGVAYVGTINGRQSASITTTNTWILITCQSQIELNEFKELVSTIK